MLFLKFEGTSARIYRPMPEIIDPVFTKTSQNARFLLSENKRFGLVFVKTGSINSGTSFGHENDRFRENKSKMLVFNPIRTQRPRSLLVLDEICAQIYKGIVFSLKTS
jgi:hypothetical protein